MPAVCQIKVVHRQARPEIKTNASLRYHAGNSSNGFEEDRAVQDFLLCQGPPLEECESVEAPSA
jgi:hypothetical protein